MDFSKLKAFMDHMAEERTPGNAVKVFLNGRSVFGYASGYANLEKQIPITGEELYYIYSCSKIATVTAGMQLLEQGKMHLTDPLYGYIPEFRDMYVKEQDGTIRKAKNTITIADLFTMTAGFGYNMKTNGFQKAKEVTNGKMDTLETIKCIASDPLHFEPGTKWKYSICHDVLAAVIGVVEGKKFREYMRENIFEPLDMKESVFHPTKDVLDRMAEQYCYVQNADSDIDIVDAQMNGTAFSGHFENVGKGNRLILGEEYDSGGAGIITTPSDYMKLLVALADNGMGLTKERILKPESIDLMRRNRLNPEMLKEFATGKFTGCGYGLGVRIHMDPSKSGLACNIGEFGWGGAAGSTVMIDDSIGLAVFYVQHTLNPREEYYQPILRNLVYTCLNE